MNIIHGIHGIFWHGWILTGVGLPVPFWVHWTSPYNSHLVDHIPILVGWCEKWGHQSWPMFNKLDFPLWLRPPMSSTRKAPRRWSDQRRRPWSEPRRFGGLAARQVPGVPGVPGVPCQTPHCRPSHRHWWPPDWILRGVRVFWRQKNLTSFCLAKPLITRTYSNLSVTGFAFTAEW